MTINDKAEALFAILKCAPMGRSLEPFRQYAEAGDVESLWRYYQNAMAKRADIRRGVESAGQVSFEMLQPAMETVYKLPVSTGIEELL
jgi:hypothetical protein